EGRRPSKFARGPARAAARREHSRPLRGAVHATAGDAESRGEDPPLEAARGHLPIGGADEMPVCGGPADIATVGGVDDRDPADPPPPASLVISPPGAPVLVTSPGRSNQVSLVRLVRRGRYRRWHRPRPLRPGLQAG